MAAGIRVHRTENRFASRVPADASAFREGTAGPGATKVGTTISGGRRYREDFVVSLPMRLPSRRKAALILRRQRRTQGISAGNT